MDHRPMPPFDGSVPVYIGPPQIALESAPRRSGPLAMVGGLVVLALVAVALLAASGKKERSAEEHLSAAQAFVSGATTVRLDYDVEATLSSGEPGARASSVATERMGGTGEWTEVAWRVTQESRYGDVEMMLVDETLYSRTSFSGSTLEDELWYEDAYTEPTREDVITSIEQLAEMLDDEDGVFGSFYDDETMAVMLGATLYVSGLDRSTGLDGELIDNPMGFVDSIRQLSEPSIGQRSDGLTTLHATLQAPADVVEALGRPIPVGAVQLDLDADDIPQAMRLEVGAGESRYWIEIRFTDWGQPVTVVAPAEDEIDSYDDWSEWSQFEQDEYGEVEVTPVDGLTPLRPDNSLGSWTLDYADAYDGYFSDVPECQEVAYLSWFLDGSEDDGWGSYVSVDLMTVACARAAAEDLGFAAETVQAVAVGELVATEIDEFTWLVVSGDTAAVVAIDSDDAALVPQIAASLEVVEWAALQPGSVAAGF